MHELALTRSIIDACSERAGGAPVIRVTVEVGCLTCVMPEALRFCFDACKADTALAGAHLEIIETPGHARCRDCGRAVKVTQIVATCPCGSARLTAPEGGDRLRVRTMELEDLLTPVATAPGGD